MRPDSAAGGARPAVVFFHGGAWRIGSREQFLPQCRRLAAAGTVGITVTYRLTNSETVTPVDCADDAAHAVRWVRDHADDLGVDSTRIAASGGSAGGQLAAAVASMGVDLAALVLFNPALAPDGTPRLAFMGEGSPDWGVGERFPPSLVLHGTADEQVPIDHSRRFAARMKALGRRCDLVEYEGMPHAFFNHPAPEGRFEETASEMERFLRSLELLWPPGGAPARVLE
ncbi:MAG: alpha/beta hydrolase [Deltaproteobacteria bacterium]|nr:alpha/beta hydrolase [Deltaproteobacteria bacterium]MBW2413696.1 alpha/beta hydrolase [Deltaproteobacteria bacterium]